MILITGAAGKTGRAIIQALSKSGETVRALVHRHDQVSSINTLGVDDVIAGDLLDQSVMERAVQGVRAIYHIAPNISPDEVTIGKIIISAAQSANVERFIFHSVLHSQIEAMPHHWQKMRVEELLFNSGLSFTVIQPAIYMQNVLAHWEQIINDGIYPVPYSPETCLSMVELNDVAEVAVKVLTEPGHQQATYELVGTLAMTQIEVANILSEQLNRNVTVRIVHLEEWERNARAFGMRDYQMATLIKMFRYYEQHGFIGNSNILRYLLQRQPASFADFVKRTAGERQNGFGVN